MSSCISNKNVEFDKLCQALPNSVLTAAELCALPHSLNDTLAYKIIHDFGNFNGTTRSIWAEIKQQPFVYPYEKGGWRFNERARAYFISRLEQQNGTFLKLHDYLKTYFETERLQMSQYDCPHGRELEWRAAYHLAPLSPEEAVKKISDIGENAAHAYRLADMKSVIDLFEEQKRWLAPYQLERTYFEGRYAYANHDYGTAEKRFKFIWENCKSNEIKIISGHLLGIIWKRSGKRHSLKNAETLLLECLELCILTNRQFQQAQVQNSLGSVLVTVGGFIRLLEAEKYFQDSLTVFRNFGDKRGIAISLNNLGNVYLKLGEIQQLDAVRKDDFEKAKNYFQDSLTLIRNVGNKRGIAIVLGRLGRLHLKLWENPHLGESNKDELDEAEKCFQESLVLVQYLGDRRGEAIIFYELAKLFVAKDKTDMARQCIENGIFINEEIGNSRAVKKGKMELKCINLNMTAERSNSNL